MIRAVVNCKSLKAAWISHTVGCLNYTALGLRASNFSRTPWQRGLSHSLSFVAMAKLQPFQAMPWGGCVPLTPWWHGLSGWEVIPDLCTLLPGRFIKSHVEVLNTKCAHNTWRGSFTGKHRFPHFHRQRRVKFATVGAVGWVDGSNRMINVPVLLLCSSGRQNFSMMKG